MSGEQKLAAAHTRTTVRARSRTSCIKPKLRQGLLPSEPPESTLEIERHEKKRSKSWAGSFWPEFCFAYTDWRSFMGLMHRKRTQIVPATVSTGAHCTSRAQIVPVLLHRCSDIGVRHASRGNRRVSPAPRRSALSYRPRPVRLRPVVSRRTALRVRALAARACKHSFDRHHRGAGLPGRRSGLHRRRNGGRSCRHHDPALADSRRRRQRHERATPMGSLARYGPSRG